MNDWVLVYTAMGDPESAVIESLLEAEGIKSKIIRESIGRLYNISINGLGKVEIFVPKEKAEEAMALIENGAKSGEEE